MTEIRYEAEAVAYINTLPISNFSATTGLIIEDGKIVGFVHEPEN